MSDQPIEKVGAPPGALPEEQGGELALVGHPAGYPLPDGAVPHDAPTVEAPVEAAPAAAVVETPTPEGQ